MLNKFKKGRRKIMRDPRFIPGRHRGKASKYHTIEAQSGMNLFWDTTKLGTYYRILKRSGEA